MFVRVVRFTGASREQLERVLARVRESGGPPEGVRSKGITFLFDEGQGTAVVLQRFETAQEMADGARILAAMDPAETPGVRASIDSCEVSLDLDG